MQIIASRLGQTNNNAQRIVRNVRTSPGDPPKPKTQQPPNPALPLTPSSTQRNPSQISARRSLASSSFARAPAKVPLFINGEFIQSKTDKWIEIRNPATQEVVGLVPEATQEELKYATDNAAEAFKTWRKTSVLARQRVMLDLQKLVRDKQDDIARAITLEQGKTLPDARGDVFRGLQVLEHACSIPTLLMGESLPVSKDMDTYNIRQPLGVVGGIMPFNFPAM
ncbi:Methylmalonate-semialdehyde dehydrogenase [acylating] mitochondrial, partial [Chytriomyces hyalinus]